MSPASGRPLVSVVMANYNGAPYLAAAIRSALAQSLSAIEVLLADDGSTDASLAIAQAIAAADPRLVVLPPAPNGGPGAARNRGLAAARGDWIAVMDSDDLMHPERLERLLAAAMRDGVDIVADDMLAFFEDGSAPQPMLHGRLALPVTVDLALYVRANALFGRLPALGYLKPLFRAEMLRRTGLHYDPSLRIAEDYDLVARLLAQGARFCIQPDLTYFYRRHGSSTSHRLRRADLEAMLASDDAFRAMIGPQPAATEAAFRARHASLECALAYDGIIAALKARDPVAVLREVVRSPGGAALLRLPMRDRLAHLLARWRKLASGAPVQGRPRGLRVHVVSHSHVVGGTGDGAAYLLSLCRALAEMGHELHLTQLSPAMSGAALRLRPEMATFRSIALRGAWRIGAWLVPKNPLMLLAMGLGIARRPGGLARGASWQTEDLLYLADRIRGQADVILADDTLLMPACAYALSPEATHIVVMHGPCFSRTELQDRAAPADRASELRLLGTADVVVAAQAEEGVLIRDALPRLRVIVASKAVETVETPQPGLGATLLFAGSNTVANADGLRWFLHEVLPLIRQAVPQVVLRVIGRIGQTIEPVPESVAGAVELLGPIPDLAPHYRDAAVVVAPLLAGSGLKGKLIEALGHGKAVVATGSALQDLQEECAPALRPIDAADEFAAEIVALLTDPALRAKRAAAALQVARERFSAAACYAGLLDYLHEVQAGAGAVPPVSGRPRAAAMAG